MFFLSFVCKDLKKSIQVKRFLLKLYCAIFIGSRKEYTAWKIKFFKIQKKEQSLVSPSELNGCICPSSTPISCTKKSIKNACAIDGIYGMRSLFNPQHHNVVCIYNVFKKITLTQLVVGNGTHLKFHFKITIAELTNLS
jgi:hypothetical protein